MSSADSGERQFAMALDAGGVIRLIWNDGAVITPTLAREALAAADELCGDTRRPLLVYVTTTASVERPARAVFGEPSKPSRIALLGSSPVDRLMANFMMGIHKPPNPVRYFTSEAAAVAWLKVGLAGD